MTLNKEEVKKEEVNKEEVKKDVPKKNLNINKETKSKPMVHIDEFIDGLVMFPNLVISSVQKSGFRGYMRNKQYLPEFADFIPHLEKYLGKKIN